MRELAKIREYQLKNLRETWKTGDLNQRVELQFAVAPDGPFWEKNNGFLNKAKPQLFQAYRELLTDLVGDGGPLSAVLERAWGLLKFVRSFGFAKDRKYGDRNLGTKRRGRRGK